MKSEPRAPAAIGLVVVLVVAVGGTCFLAVGTPGALLVPAGTMINQRGFNVTFNISGGSARVIGAWSANHGGTVTICPLGSDCVFLWPRCPPADILWNVTLDASFSPGSWVIRFSPQFWPGSGNTTIVITQPIRLVYPGVSPSSTGVYWRSGFGLKC